MVINFVKSGFVAQVLKMTERISMSISFISSLKSANVV
jgi:hypothetical protein